MWLKRGWSIQGHCLQFLISRAALTPFHSVLMNMPLSNIWCLFSPRKVWESKCVPAGSQDCYPMLWCICMFNSGGSGRHALLLWSLSGKTCGEQTCSVALAFVRKNTWPNSKKVTLSIMPNLCSCLLSRCSVSDRWNTKISALTLCL